MRTDFAISLKRPSVEIQSIQSRLTKGWNSRIALLSSTLGAVIGQAMTTTSSPIGIAS